ncbi:MAG TPA: hypothetical protein VJR30_05880 [Bradyrhizobium sp.]|nr:hypothetical protein [Bradyrhizobium sp.]
MADKAKQEFGKRAKVSVPPSPTLPPKRSNHVALLVMGTLAVGGTAYTLMPHECTPAASGTTPTVSSPAECPPRGSSSSSHGGSSGYRYGYSSSGSSSSTAATTDASSSTVKRGGFGSFAHSFSSHFSFGS